MEVNPRPHKRARTTPPTEARLTKDEKMLETQLQGSQLLLALPSLLVHPPTHSEHKKALAVSLLALRRCLGLSNPKGQVYAGAGDRMQSDRKGGPQSDLSPPDECRAWCALAEIGLCVLDGGFGAEPWAAGVESEVDKALGKALPIAQRHPSLASYPPYLTRLSARAAPHRARQLLRPPPSTFGSSAITIPGGITAYYYTHLTWADHLLQTMLYPTAASAAPPPLKQRTLLGSGSGASSPANATKLRTPTTSPVKASSSPLTREKELLARDLAALRAALAPLMTAPHVNVVLLARVIELRALIALGRWTEVSGALARAEGALGIVLPVPGSPAPLPASDTTQEQQAPPPPYATSPFHAALVVHVLVLGVVWFGYSATPPPLNPLVATQQQDGGGVVTGGIAVSARLTLLYTLLDAGVYNGKCRAVAGSADGQSMGLESEGVLEVPLDSATLPLYIRTTHPRVLYALGYLVSAVARRDLVGRKPKRKTFILEGLGVVEREAARELRVPRWASAGDVHAVEVQMHKIKADLMCELIAVSIMRSEFEEAQKILDEVIAHARTHALFGGTLAPRITLLHAQLAHAQGRAARARTCYRVAAQLAGEARDAGGEAAARAGEMALLVGLRARARVRASGREVPPLAEEELAEEEEEAQDAELVRLGREVAGTCRGLGGAMRAVGEVIEGVLTTEILRAKQHFKNALSYATETQDNHLRALILALIAAHYLHTAGDQAQKMLATCEQLAAGLGAPGKKTNKERVDTVGNAPLRLWVGERFLELHKRDGREDFVTKREEANGVLRQAVVALAQRGQSES
ncbi:hypothetical protein C8F04DRAFT_1392448 [Mycena alexandri]|uniref:Uncharacterized protein n=1 Tax=Mycena alexandri TaxID=1745969 RepID=A0AAD6T7T5_9AGAR|nr:hypothetical protein C8F04DRAFT_1392448 [Mycena alexandri]